MTRLDADDRQPGARQPLKKPLRQGPGLETDPFNVQGRILQDGEEIVRVADDPHLAADPAGFIDNANRGLFHRDIEADKVLHTALPFLMLVAVWTDHVLSSARSAAPSCITVEDGAQAEYPIC